MEYSFIIRKAEPQDVPAIQEILRASFAEYVKGSGIPLPVEAFLESAAEIEADIRASGVYVAFMDGAPVGTVRVSRDPDDPSRASLTKFGVLPGYQNIGIGKSLVNLVDKLNIAEGVKTLTLHTAAKNFGLMRFYYGRGFYVDSTTKDRGYVRALMVKEY